MVINSAIIRASAGQSFVEAVDAPTKCEIKTHSSPAFSMKSASTAIECDLPIPWLPRTMTGDMPVFNLTDSATPSNKPGTPSPCSM